MSHWTFDLPREPKIVFEDIDDWMRAFYRWIAKASIAEIDAAIDDYNAYFAECDYEICTKIVARRNRRWHELNPEPAAGP